jgi:radical SAM superfamily enzyme YgiQ (UPF0313 family)
MKIALINPDRNSRTQSYVLKGYNLGLLVIGGLTPKSCETVFIDETKDSINFESDYDVVAISSMTYQATRAYEIAREFRARGKIVVMGGMHPTILPKEAKQHADSVIIGEAEEIWPEFINDVQHNNIKPFYKAHKTADLTKSPMPAYNKINFNKYEMILMETSRGCSYECEFCSIPNLHGKKKRYKTVDQIRNELIEIYTHEKDRSKILYFTDDNFGLNRKYVKDVLNEIKDFNLYWGTQTDISVAEDEKFLDFLRCAGCAYLFIGFETLNHSRNGNQGKFKYVSRYKEFVQKINSHGITVVGLFIIGFDDDTVETFKRISDFVNENNMKAMLSILTPYPGTKTREKLLKEKRLISDNWEQYNFENITFVPKNMSLDEMTENFNNWWLTLENNEPFVLIRREERLTEIEEKNIMETKTTYPLPPGVHTGDNGSSEKIKIHRFSCYNHKSWALMPKMLDRIKLFCDRYDTETKPSFLIPQIRQMFAIDNPYLGLWGVIDGDKEIVGHILVTVEQYCNEPYLLVMQAECINNVETTKKIFDEVIKWGQSNKIRKIHITTERLPEAFIRKYKFRKLRTILIKDI